MFMDTAGVHHIEAFSSRHGRERVLVASFGGEPMRPPNSLAVLASRIAMAALMGGMMFVQEASASDDGAEHQAGRSAVMERGADEPYFQMSVEERRSFVAKVQRIKLGESRQNVESLLGKPWSDHVGASKETGRFLGRFVDYYLKRHFKDAVNEKLDEWIMLKFDSNDQLVKVVSRAADIPSRP